MSRAATLLTSPRHARGMRAWAAALLVTVAARCACAGWISPPAGRGSRRPLLPGAGRRSLSQEQQSPPSPPAVASSDSSDDTYWSILRPCHGGGVLNATGSSLRYISVPNAALLGTTLRTVSHPTEEACAAACAATNSCHMYNYCPLGATQGCEMDGGLVREPVGTCRLLQLTAVQSGTILPLLGNGSGIATTAGAPVLSGLGAVPLDAGAYEGTLGVSIFGSGNLKCQQSFQESICAISGEVSQLAAACDAQPGCNGFTLASGAAPLLSSTQGGSTVGILNRGTLATAFSPFCAAYGKVQGASAPPPAPSCTNPPGQGDAASWSVLWRPQGGLYELRGDVGVAYAVVVPQTLLPGAQVAVLSVERSFDDCLRRCIAHPQCTSVNFCPALPGKDCIIGTLGISSFPAGACSLLWEESVAQNFSVAILATGPALATIAGIPVTAPANQSVPGYRQHLSQALLGSSNLSPELCLDSLRQNYCQLEGTLEELAERCRVHPNCTGFVFREAGLTLNVSNGVLKGVGGGPFDPRHVNWSPGASLYAKEGFLDDAPLLPADVEQQLSGNVPSPSAAAAAASGGGLSAGAIAGIAVGSVAVVAAAVAALWLQRRRRRRRKAGHATGKPSIHLSLSSQTGNGDPRKKDSSNLASDLTEVQLSGAVQQGSSSESAALQLSSQLLPGASPRSPGLGPASGSGSAPRDLSSFEGRLLSSMPAAGAQLDAASTWGSSQDAATGGASGIGSFQLDDTLSSGALALVSRLLNASAGWEEMLVPESAVTFMEGPNGRPAVLGQGGFGSVYKVLLHGHTVCAAKILEWEGAEHLQTMFVQEASMMRRLQHPNVVQLMGICMSDTRGTLLMECCAGRDLDAAMHARVRSTGGRLLDWGGRGRRVAQDIAAGLAYLHDRKILHLDLKPHNILLTREGLAKIGDVGLARLVNRTHLSVNGQFGTLDYAAPEVLMGRGATYAADIWSFGVLLFQIVTGEQHRRGQLRPLRAPEECPAAVAELQHRCVSSDPTERPTAAEVLEVLRATEVPRQSPRGPAASLVLSPLSPTSTQQDVTFASSGGATPQTATSPSPAQGVSQPGDVLEKAQTASAPLPAPALSAADAMVLQQPQASSAPLPASPLRAGDAVKQGTE